MLWWRALFYVLWLENRKLFQGLKRFHFLTVSKLASAGSELEVNTVGSNPG